MPLALQNDGDRQNDVDEGLERGSLSKEEESLISESDPREMEKILPGYRPYSPVSFHDDDNDDHPPRPVHTRNVFRRHGQTFLTVALGLLLLLSLFRGPVPLLRSYQPSDNTARFFQDLYAPFVHRDLFEPATYFSDITNTTKTLTITGGPVWTTPLGKDVLILDLDTRPFNGSNQLLNDASVAWNDLERSSAGLLNHYMYSLIHGYDYKFIRPKPPTDRFASWTKPGTLSSILATNNYRFIVFSDADAVWNHPEIPLESLMNHWNITTETSLSISLDPAWCIDSRGRGGLNTGFIIAQNNDRTREILDAWSGCPEKDSKYKNCSFWANKRVFEQTAFNEYIRYDFDRPEDVKSLPCNETDGYVDSPDRCNGELIRHFWRDKDLVKMGVASPLLRMMGEKLDELRGYFVEHKGDLLVEEVKKWR